MASQRAVLLIDSECYCSSLKSVTIDHWKLLKQLESLVDVTLFNSRLFYCGYEGDINNLPSVCNDVKISPPFGPDYCIIAHHVVCERNNQGLIIRQFQDTLDAAMATKIAEFGVNRNLNSSKSCDVIVLLTNNDKTNILQAMELAWSKGIRVYVISSANHTSTMFEPYRMPGGPSSLDDLMINCLSGGSKRKIEREPLTNTTLSAVRTGKKQKATEPVSITYQDVVYADTVSGGLSAARTSQPAATNFVSPQEMHLRLRNNKEFKSAREINLRQNFSRDEFDVSSVSGVVLTISGALVAAANGTYKFAGVMNRAGYFSQRGIFNGAGPGNYMIYRYRLPHKVCGGYFHWFLSFVQTGVKVGSPQDRNLYWSDGGDRDCPVPNSPWLCLTQNYRNDLAVSMTTESPGGEVEDEHRPAAQRIVQPWDVLPSTPRSSRTRDEMEVEPPVAVTEGTKELPVTIRRQINRLRSSQGDF